MLLQSIGAGHILVRARWHNHTTGGGGPGQGKVHYRICVTGVYAPESRLASRYKWQTRNLTDQYNRAAMALEVHQRNASGLILIHPQMKMQQKGCKYIPNAHP